MAVMVGRIRFDDKGIAVIDSLSPASCLPSAPYVTMAIETFLGADAIVESEHDSQPCFDVDEMMRRNHAARTSRGDG